MSKRHLVGQSNEFSAARSIWGNTESSSSVRVLSKNRGGVLEKMFKGCLAHTYPSEKWNVQNRNVKVNDFVIVSGSNTVRGKWNTGKIVEVFQGDDGLVRNVKVKATAGVYSQPMLSKICVIYPAEGNEDE